MKSLKLFVQLISAFLFISSCVKEGKISTTQVNPQKLSLKKPNTILNDIAKGEFNSQIINSLVFENFNNTPRAWVFDVFPNTNKIKSIKHYGNLTTPYLCEIPVTYYKYQNELIDEIEIFRQNVCQLYESKTILKYNYEGNVLVSITAKVYYSDSTVSNKLMQTGENYFSYNSDGTVFELYADMRSVTQPFSGYGKLTLFYDSNKNVIESRVEDYSTNLYDRRYTFEYDNNINPLKGLYIFSTFLNSLPNNGVESILGPNYLSNNCIKSVKIENLNRPTPFPETKFFTLNKINNRITDFGSDSNYPFWFRNYLY